MNEMDALKAVLSNIPKNEKEKNSISNHLMLTYNLGSGNA